MKIFINPGHGGTDPGACGNGLKKRDVVLKIGRRVADYLRKVNYDVKLAQIDGLQEICDASNNWGADLFVSIHCNSFNTYAKGTETFYFYGSSSGEKLATCIHKQLVKSLPLVDRGVKQKGYQVLAGTDCPAALVECAFIDNPNDARLLVDKEDEFASAIARGVTDYFANEKPLPDVIDTPADKKVGKHFDISEFVCHCCGLGADKIDPRLIELLEELRAKAGAPIHVNCGYRCPAHNAEVGGVPNSQHVLGTAADITIPQIGFSAAERLVKASKFDGTVFYPPVDSSGLWFIHVDVRDGGVGSHIEWYD